MKGCAWHKCPHKALPEQTDVPNADGKTSRPEWLCEWHAALVADFLCAAEKTDALLAKWEKLIEENEVKR